MKVGILVPQNAAEGGGTWQEIREVARRAEDAGLDSLWISDHFLYRPPDGHEVGYHEPWTLLAALAAVTSRVELGFLVLATSFRPAGITAKMAAIADDIAGARLILGLGCGWHEPEYRAFGYPFDHRVGRFEETLRIVVPLLNGERVTMNGVWSQVADAVLLPPPRRRPPILVAAKGDRMLRLTARHADQWQTAWFGLPDDRFADRLERLRTACATEGRDPSTLALTVGLGIADEGDDPGPMSLARDSAAIADGLRAWAAEGIDHVQLSVNPVGGPTIDLVAEAVRRFREAP